MSGAAEGIRCMMMRGGTSKGAYFLREDLPDTAEQRNALLLAIMGSPDARQIDGIGGAHPLTSKVAVVGPSSRDDADVDYLFLQVVVDRPVVSDRQNCGNLLAGVGPFALERGLVAPPPPGASTMDVRIHQVNDGAVTTATFSVNDGRPCYRGATAIAGVPGTAGAITLRFADTAGSTCGALLPTGSVVDHIAGIDVTCIDNGMPTIVMLATDCGIAGDEPPEVLEGNTALRQLLETIRLEAGPRMGLGDVTELTVPKLTMVSAPRAGGALCTRTFIPHRCHDAIGVLGAVSVATAALIPGTPAAQLAELPPTGEPVVLEHPTGDFGVLVDLDLSATQPNVGSCGVVRTARKLFDGTVFPREFDHD